MKALGMLAFGALALIAASFASAAPAKADSFGIFVGDGGFGIHISDYGHHRGYYRRGCWDPYYERYVPCRPRYYYDGYYHRGHRWHRRGHRHDVWRHGHRSRHDGWRGGHRGRHDGWRGGHRGRHDGHRRRGHRGHH